MDIPDFIQDIFNPQCLAARYEKNPLACNLTQIGKTVYCRVHKSIVIKESYEK